MASKKPRKGAPKWMATFADLMTLVLVFFILLFSMSQVDAIKFEQLKDSFDQKQPLEGLVEVSGTEMELASGKHSFESIEKTVERVVERTKELDDLYERVLAFVEENDLESQVEVTREDEGVKIVITDNLLFDTAEAEILPEARRVIAAISGFMSEVDNDIIVEGHTDNRPISSLQYPSNWELSGARASSIIRYLSEDRNIEPERLRAVGYGDTQPIAPNNGEGNWQKNRRVVIFIEENL